MGATRKVIEWTPGKWWVVDHDERPGHGYTPLYEGKGSTSTASKKDAERWLLADAAGLLKPAVTVRLVKGFSGPSQGTSLTVDVAFAKQMDVRDAADLIRSAVTAVLSR